MFDQVQAVGYVDASEVGPNLQHISELLQRDVPGHAISSHIDATKALGAALPNVMQTISGKTSPDQKQEAQLVVAEVSRVASGVRTLSMVDQLVAMENLVTCDLRHDDPVSSHSGSYVPWICAGSQQVWFWICH